MGWFIERTTITGVGVKWVVYCKENVPVLTADDDVDDDQGLLMTLGERSLRYGGLTGPWILERRSWNGDRGRYWLSGGVRKRFRWRVKPLKFLPGVFPRRLTSTESRQGRSDSAERGMSP